jgi:transcriptional regulator with XRE-family HTH domain
VLEKEFNVRYYGRPVSFQGVSRWLKGLSIPTQDKLQVLAEWLQVEPHVLRFGMQRLNRIQLKRSQWDMALRGQDREVLEVFVSLPAEQKQVARAVILALAKDVETP